MKRYNSNDNEIMAIILMVLGIIFLVIFIPALSFAASYFGGWIVSLVIGKQLAFALNMLFNTTYFNPLYIKWYAAALGWIGGFFKVINTKSRN